MPSSTEQHLSFIVGHIRGLKASRVLDCGVGFGKWGFLCREYLESFPGHPMPDTWTTHIEGVEAFKPYVENFRWVHMLYNQIHVGTLQTVLPTLKEPFDLVIAGDVLEHLPKDEGIIALGELWRLTRKRLIISLPIGVGWLHNSIVCDNQFEMHQGAWEVGEPQLTMRCSPTATQSISESRGKVVAFVFDKEG